MSKMKFGVINKHPESSLQLKCGTTWDKTKCENLMGKILKVEEGICDCCYWAKPLGAVSVPTNVHKEWVSKYTQKCRPWKPSEYVGGRIWSIHDYYTPSTSKVHKDNCKAKSVEVVSRTLMDIIQENS